LCMSGSPAMPMSWTSGWSIARRAPPQQVKPFLESRWIWWCAT
jgi:hypothetical protein